MKDNNDTYDNELDNETNCYPTNEDDDFFCSVNGRDKF